MFPIEDAHRLVGARGTFTELCNAMPYDPLRQQSGLKHAVVEGAPTPIQRTDPVGDQYL